MAQRRLEARLQGVDGNLERSGRVLDAEILVVMQRDRGSLVGSKPIECLGEIESGLARHLAFAAAEPAETLGERLEAVTSPVRRNAFVHSNPCQPGSRILVAQAVDPLPRFEEGFLDRVLSKRLVAEDQTGRPQEL